ncbi:MAG: hypothetical protein FJ091_08120 [Deltaproteobacteria bacterium]|nr:hypothetical protein [Deltaproteobacteria bacterium]
MKRISLLLLAALCSCDIGPNKLPDMALYADGLDSERSVAPQRGLTFDPAVSVDGRGSFRIEASGERTVIHLADVPIEAPKLPRVSYRAKLRGENVAGRAYLEMWVTVKNHGEFFSRALHSQISGTSDWSTHEAPFFLEADQEPTRAKLNVVVEGTGTVWVDGIRLSAGRD